MRRRAVVRLALACATTLAIVVATGLWWPRSIEIGSDMAPSEAPGGDDDGTFTIVALGTSLTAHYDWPDRLGRRLSDCLGNPVKVISIARGGATSRWGAGQMARVAAENPDLVLVEFSINDADLRRGVSLAESTRLHRRMVSELARRTPRSRVVLMSMSPALGLKRLLRPRLARYYTLYFDLARESGAGFVDLYSVWMDHPQVGTAFPDGVHPTASVMSEVTVPTLLRYLFDVLSLDPGGARSASCPASRRTANTTLPGSESLADSTVEPFPA